MHTLLADFAHLRQAEHLEAAGVGQYRPLPVGKIVQVSVFFDDFGARAQHQMESITQNDLRTEILQFFRGHRLHRAVGAYRHEGRGLYRSARKIETSATRQAIV